MKILKPIPPVRWPILLPIGPLLKREPVEYLQTLKEGTACWGVGLLIFAELATGEIARIPNP